MDRNSIIGIILIAGILILWSVIFSPNKKELEERRRQQDSLALVLQQQQEMKQKQLPVSDSALAVTSDTAKEEKMVQYGE
jgi:YidC/Oxa1 family membrane protein insertase